MESFRKWFYKPKKDDTSLLAQFFFADETLNLVTAELDSFDGRKDPERCTILVNHLRQCQDKVLKICNKIMNQLIPNDRASRDFRVKFPDDVNQENLAGQLWFGAECLAAGSSIVNREAESSAMRPLAKALTKSLENVRNLLREQCFRTNSNTQANSHLFNDKLLEALKIFDRLFAEFELRYVSAMVPVKSPRDYYLQQLVVVLFSETLQRALRLNLLTQDMVDDYDPALMFAIPRLAIVSGLLIFSDGPISLDSAATDMSEMFRPFRTLLLKIRALLWTLNSKELFTLEKLLCSCEDPNIDFSDTNSYGKCIDESEKQDVETALPKKERHNCGYGGDDIDYESISSNGNGIDDGTVSLPSSINCKDNPTQSANQSAFKMNRTESISIPNESNPSGYLNVNRVSLNCIGTPNDAPIVVGHSLPDGDHDETLNIVTETLSSLLNSSDNNESADATVKSNTNSNFKSSETDEHLSENSVNYQSKCDYYKPVCDCFENICQCYATNSKTYETDTLESEELKKGVLENKNFGQGRVCLNEPDSLISPDSGLGNSEVENPMPCRSPDDTINSPSTSKENTSPESEKVCFPCYDCVNIRSDRHSSNCNLHKDDNYSDSGSSPFMNCELKESSLLSNCDKTLTEETCTVVEEHNEEWVGIATGDGDTKTNDVNFYYQNEESNEQSSHCDLRQNYWDNWETLINNQGQVENNRNTVSLELPRNLVINVRDEIASTGQSETFRIRTSTLIPLQNFENTNHSQNGNVDGTKSLNNMNITRKREIIKRKKFHRSKISAPTSRENISLQIPSHSKRLANGPTVGSSFSSSCSSCVTSETCSFSSDTSSFNSEMQDVEEIALALQAAETAYRDDVRARFRSSEDLIHRLFVCIAGIADQLQTNFAGDLRNILKSVFSMNATLTDSDEESEETQNGGPANIAGDSSRIENAEEAWENTAAEMDRSDESASQETNGSAEVSRKEMENPPPWIPDVMAPKCMTCEAVFTLVRRRHHCRNCGKVFCSKCSSNSVPLPRYGHIKPVRVCNRCFLYQVTPFTMEEIPASS